MTPQAFIAAIQEKMGDGFTVAAHPKRRAEPQFDVHPEPREADKDGNPYRVVFSVRSRTLADINADAKIITEYAETIAQNIALQKARGAAAPVWKS